MKFPFQFRIPAALMVLTGALCSLRGFVDATPPEAHAAKSYEARGQVVQINATAHTLVVKHEAIPEFMPAMTMPFRVKDSESLVGFVPGDQITFRLLVSDTESWIDQIHKTAKPSPAPPPSPPATGPGGATNALSFYLAEIPDFALTNELGKRVSLHQFGGQAVAVTFFFTRCPIPEYCPRLAKNFAEASRKLGLNSGGPTNWHLLSISFDPADTPEVLRRYGEQYHYDPHHWSFLTGDPAQIRSLTRGFGLSVTQESGLFLHDFRTAVFDANGRLQAMWPFGGDTSTMLVQELTRAAKAATR
jgi:protein SCO1